MIHLLNMKIVLLILFILPVFALDYQKSADYSALTNTYKDKIKDSNPDRIVVSIMDQFDPDFLFLEEVSFDSPDLSDNEIVIFRPSGPYTQALISCQSEKGTAVIAPDGLSIKLTDISFPFRFQCRGGTGSYSEFYSTFKQ